MNTEADYSICCESPEATSRLGERLGALLVGGEVIELSSDLGGGKTWFAKAIARGLGLESEVASPTFTISRVYKLPSGRELHHFDFYRVPTGDVVAAELSETIGRPEIITIIEWADTAGDVLPADRLRVVMTPTGEFGRQLDFWATGPRHSRLVQELAV